MDLGEIALKRTRFVSSKNHIIHNYEFKMLFWAYNHHHEH